jgi:type III pantothenate kinase
MLLAVDVGNTQTHFGAFRGEELVEHWRFATVRDSTADELGAAVNSLLALRGFSFDDLSESVVSSTVPALGEEWRRVGEDYLGHETIVVGPGTRTGMALRYDNPREIGADRLVNAVAAFDRFASACIVVDFGTAITFDPVSAKGEYLGGVIAPGVEISLEALTERAAKLPKIDLAPPREVIANRTVEALRAGVIYGFAGLVDGILRRILTELGPDVKIIATGGLAHAVVPSCEEISEIDDLLTLTGLRLINSLNRG